MITLGDILSTPFFENFRLTTAKNGLNNPIETTGFFEWETGADIKKSFGKGEFVVTTLTVAKDNPAYAEKILRSLISNRVGAIAIKDVYYKSLTDDIIEYSNKLNVPILFFTETYIDDVLFNVKMAIMKEADNPYKKDELTLLIKEDSFDDEQRRNIINTINSYFLEGSVICAYISKRDDVSTINRSLYDDFKKGEFDMGIDEDQESASDPIYMFIPYIRGLLLIYTTKHNSGSNNTDLGKFLKKYFKMDDTIRIGISTVHKGLESLHLAIKEAVYANTISIVQQKKTLRFDYSSSDMILCSVCYDPWIIKHYNSISDRFDGVPNDGSDTLKETLYAYVENEGDIGLTSQASYQHGNTIRYRLMKIKKLLGIDNDLTLFSLAHSFVFLSKIYTLLDPIFKNTK